MCCNNSEIRERLLQEDDVTLDQAIQKSKILETSKARNEAINRNQGIDVIQKNNPTQKKSENKKMIRNCKKCGHSHPINKCPAYGKEWLFCHLPNNFANCCYKKKNVHEVYVEEEDKQNKETEKLFIGRIEVSCKNHNEWVTNFK